MRYKGSIKFYAEDFYGLLNKQKYRCALTNRELTPANTEVELRDPHRVKGRAELDNHYLIDKAISPTARHLSEDEIIKLAIEIVQHRGEEFGCIIRRVKQ